MTVEQVASALTSLALVVTLAHMCGHAATRLRQPRLVGEIAAGVLLGPFVLGRIAPGVSAVLFGSQATPHPTAISLSFLSWLGLLLLMFLSGSEVRRVLTSENRRASLWLLCLGTAIPFVGVLALFPVLPLERLAGPVERPGPVLLVLACSVAVTSIPVISRIFHDLGILQTRFASLVLSVAIVEDVALWALLAVATSLATAPVAVSASTMLSIGGHVAVTSVYMTVGLFAAPQALKPLGSARWNVIAQASTCGYALLILLVYTSVATALGVNLVFAAFMAGFGLVGGFDGSERARFSSALDAVSQVGLAVFIPLYFVFVGHQLDLGHGFSIPMFIAFLVGSSLLRIFSVALAARCAGFHSSDMLNLAVTMNARGGPGIVLSSVAYSAGIINGVFFTTLVITAVLTSQAAGAWLDYVLRCHRPLLSATSERECPVVPATLTKQT